MPVLRPSVFAALALTAWAFAAPAWAREAVAWNACPREWNLGDWPSLAGRLQCAEISVPLDQRHPDGRMTTIDVIRVRAADPSRREGSIFFNPGGPGGHPAPSLLFIANVWTLADLESPAGAYQWALATRYDLVGVVPRGLGRRWRHDCLKGVPTKAAFLPTHRDDRNWQLAVDDARRQAKLCTADSRARYINTEQHVRDMETVRTLLGDQRIHFYGASYGGLVGPWYAALFPERMGRMLLDSPLYFHENFQQAIRITLDAIHRQFNLVVQTTAASPESLGLPPATDVVGELWSMPAGLRELWHDAIYSPYHLAAAFHMRHWVTDTSSPDWAALATKASSYPFSEDVETQALVREAALDLLAPRGTAPGPLEPDHRVRTHRRADTSGDTVPGFVFDSVWLTTLCNDGPWWGSLEQIRSRADTWATNYWAWDGRDVAPYLVCRLWGGHSADRPDFSSLASIPPFLMLQAAFDLATPLRGAEALLARHDNAHLVVATRSAEHGLFNVANHACIDVVAARFLLTGELPSARRTECAAPVSP